MAPNLPIPKVELQCIQELERIWKIKFTSFETLTFSHSVGHVEDVEPDTTNRLGLTNLRHEMLLELMRLKAIMRRHNIISPEELEEVCNGIVVYNGHVVGLGLYLTTIESIPNIINQLPELRILCFNSNMMEKISENIGDLKHLHTLKIIHNNIRTLPDSIRHLTSLKKLVLFGNHLEMIPNVLNNLKELMEFDISSNIISEIPSSICELTALKDLDISENQIIALPSNIDKLQKLQILDGHANPIRELTESLGFLSNLSAINFSHANLTAIPRTFVHLLKLQTIDISNNQFTAIPVALHGLPFLTEIKLNNNQIEEISDDFCRNMRVEILELHNNHISKISHLIGLLPLRSLNLNQNFLTQLPDSIAKMPHLETLLLCQNHFRDIPSIIHSLPAIVNLEMDGNPFGFGLPNGLQWQKVNIMRYLERRLRLYPHWGPQVILEKLQNNIPLDDVDRTHPEFVKFLSLFLQYIEKFQNNTSNELNDLIAERAMISQGHFTILL